MSPVGHGLPSRPSAGSSGLPQRAAASASVRGFRLGPKASSRRKKDWDTFASGSLTCSLDCDRVPIRRAVFIDLYRCPWEDKMRAFLAFLMFPPALELVT
jgi:hypothetical protein